MYDLEQFLNEKESKSYDATSNFSDFLRELMKVPGYKEKFDRLVESDPKWLKAALAEMELKHTYLQFLLSVSSVYFGEVPPNELELGLFNNQEDAVVKVTTYKKVSKPAPPLKKW